MSENKAESIAIIMDGNRRYAKERGWITAKGHKAGAENLKKIALAAKALGVKYLIVFAFSTENWKRSEEEKEALFQILENFLQNELENFKKESVKLLFIGQKERFSDKMQKLLQKAEKETKGGVFTLAIALSYGARQEIARAAQSAARALPPEKINEESFAEFLWTKDIKDPDILVRTGKEKRISNFLLWQIAYSEIFFVDKYWPEFSEENLKQILEEFKTRKRRFGV